MPSSKPAKPMHFVYVLFGLLIQIPFSWHFFSPSSQKEQNQVVFDTDIYPAAHQLFKYHHFLKDKRLGLVVNHTSTIDKTHLVDTLLALDYKIQKIFAPEHGFRGKADAGEHIEDKVDTKTAIPIISVYGRDKKPSAEHFENIDLVIFDIQDVGARFYTYTSTMTYIMEACAEYKVPLLILDRPNPLGHYVDGPILKKNQRSFVGLHPVPIVHGLTTAEYALMINGEHWLKDSLQCELYYVECGNYSHKKFYTLPIKPSPNLPNMQSIYLYPSLCLFEGTSASVGRGTDKQFQVYGHPSYPDKAFRFVPEPKEGAKHPKHKGKACYGEDLSKISIEDLQKQKQLNFEYMLRLYSKLSVEEKAIFFRKNGFFNLLAGNTKLQQQIEDLLPIETIRNSWRIELENYKLLRSKYLLYPDF